MTENGVEEGWESGTWYGKQAYAVGQNWTGFDLNWLRWDFYRHQTTRIGSVVMCILVSGMYATTDCR